MKGPVPQKGIDIAMPLAIMRGFVIPCKRANGSVADFIIAGPGWTAIISIRRTRKLNELVADMARQFPVVIAGLGRVPPVPGRSCEIWACDYYGNIRFFQVTGPGLVEIGPDGNPLADPTGAVKRSFPQPNGEGGRGGSTKPKVCPVKDLLPAETTPKTFALPEDSTSAGVT